MAIAFDAASESHTASSNTATADYSWTHTPVGTPRGVVVLILEDQSTATADNVAGVTYGGTAMTEVALSPFQYDVADDPVGATHVFFLGSSVPTGAQTVAVDMPASPTGNQKAVAFTVTAAADTEVADTSTGTSTASITVQVPASVTAFVCGVIHSGNASPTGLTAGADYTAFSAVDFGAQSGKWSRRTNNSAGGDTTYAWSGTGTHVLFGMAIREVAGAGPQTISPTGIASQEAVGAPTVSPGPVTLSPTGIASGEAVGALQVTPGPVSVSPTGIATAEAFGTPIVTMPQPQTVSPTGIASTETFGTATVVAEAPPTGNREMIFILEEIQEAGLPTDPHFWLPPR